jgi:hypothetical protein
MWGSRHPVRRGAVEHGSRTFYVVGTRNLATAIEDKLRRIILFYKLQSV